MCPNKDLGIAMSFTSPQAANGNSNASRREEKWCGREDSNFHGFYPTATSTLRVYQFRHDRTVEPAGAAKAAEQSRDRRVANCRAGHKCPFHRLFCHPAVARGLDAVPIHKAGHVNPAFILVGPSPPA